MAVQGGVCVFFRGGEGVKMIDLGSTILYFRYGGVVVITLASNGLKDQGSSPTVLCWFMYPYKMNPSMMDHLYYNTY